MLYILYGEDQFRAREELRRIRAGLDKDGNLAHNTVRVAPDEARRIPPNDLKTMCHSASFFAEDRLVIIEGLGARLSGSRRGRAGARGASGSDLDGFVDVLSTLPPTTTVVLLDEGSRQPAYLEALKPHATVKDFPVLKGGQLRAWANERVREGGANFDPQALDRLTSLIDGAHLGELASEIDKLTTYAYGRQVRSEDVDTLTSAAVEMHGWDLTDAVIQGRGDRALQVIQMMKDDKDQPPQLLLAMVRNQYRRLLLAQSLLREGLSQNQVGEQLGVRGFPLEKLVSQASRYEADRLEKAYRLLLKTDVDVKTGILDVDMALQMLIVELAEIARTPRTAAASRR